MVNKGGIHCLRRIASTAAAWHETYAWPTPGMLLTCAWRGSGPCLACFWPRLAGMVLAHTPSVFAHAWRSCGPCPDAWSGSGPHARRARAAPMPARWEPRARAAARGERRPWKTPTHTHTQVRRHGCLGSAARRAQGRTRRGDAGAPGEWADAGHRFCRGSASHAAACIAGARARRPKGSRRRTPMVLEY